MTTETQHPTAEELVALATAELDNENAKRLRQHVDHCEECRNLVQDLADFPDIEPPDDSYIVTDDEFHATREQLKGQLFPVSVPVVEEDVDRPTVSSRRTPVFWLMAAALLLASGWGLYASRGMQRLETQVMDLQERLSSGMRTESLVASDNPLRTTGDMKAISLESAVFIILLADELPTTPMIAEVRNLDGEVMDSVSPQKVRATLMNIKVFPGDLVPGDYQVFLIDNEGSELPFHFDLRIAE